MTLKMLLILILTCTRISNLLFAISAPETKPIVILSLDGGGVRGLIEAIILAELEKQLGVPIINLVDVMVGTSTGGLITLALSTPASDKTALYRPKDLVHLYQLEMKNIFDPSFLNKIRRTFGLWRTKYSVDYFDQWLTKQFKLSLLKNALIPTAVTTYNTTKAEPVLLTSTSGAKLYENISFKAAARATTAAPLYFDPFQWFDHKLLDGGIYANNPSSLGLRYARQLFPNHLSYIIISLGTGTYRHSGYQGGGILTGGIPIVQQLLHMPEQLIPFQFQDNTHVSYYRLQPLLRKKISLDDTTQNEFLQKAAHKAIMSPMFEYILTILHQYKTSRTCAVQ